MQETEKYPSAMKIMHWFMAFLLLSMIAAGWYMSGLESGDPLRSAIYSLHKSFGITLLGLMVLRIVIRLFSIKPPLPAEVKPIEKLAAKSTYVVMYALMFLIPFTGYKMTNHYGAPLKWFGIEMPRLFEVDRAEGHTVGELHEILAYTLLALIAIHIAGFLKHLIIDKSNLLKRMW